MVELVHGKAIFRDDIERIPLSSLPRGSPPAERAHGCRLYRNPPLNSIRRGLFARFEVPPLEGPPTGRFYLLK